MLRCEGSRGENSACGLKNKMLPKFRCASLPPDLLDLIAKRLDNPDDFRRFRAVCQSWRSSTSFRANLLSFVFPYNLKSISQPGSLGEFITGSFESLAIIASNTYILQPLYPNTCDADANCVKPWLIRVEEIEAGKLRVRMPLDHNESISLLQPLPKKLILSNFKVILVSTGYNFTRYRYRPPEKLLLYPSSHSSNSNTNDEALVLRCGWLYIDHLQNEKWTQVKAGSICNFDDIIRFRGLNYTIDRRGRLHYFNSQGSLSYVVYTPLCNYSHGEGRKRLVEWCDNLYMVRRDENVIRVYKLNEQQKRPRWDEIGDLGGKLLFVAIDSCFFLNPKLFPGCKENLVIFQNNSFHPDTRRLMPRVPSLFGRGHPPWGDASRDHNLPCVYRWGATYCESIAVYPELWDTFWPPPRLFRPLMDKD